MRNLILLAVAYAVVPSETDVEQLGFEPTEEDFKNYFEIPAETQQGVVKENFDAYGDLRWLLNDEEKAILDPDTVKADGISTSETSDEVKDAPVTDAETVSDEPKELVIPDNFKAKHKDLTEELETQGKIIKGLEKDLEKVKAENAKKVEKAQTALDKQSEKVKADSSNPVHLSAEGKLKSALNVASNEAKKAEKSSTTAINKAVEKLEKIKTNFTKLIEKIKEANKKASDKAADKALTDANKGATAAKKEVTELSRSKHVYLLLDKGWTVKQILEANPSWAKSHVTNCSQSLKTDQKLPTPILIAKSQEIAIKLGIVIPEAPAVTVAEPASGVAVSGEVVETSEEATKAE